MGFEIIVEKKHLTRAFYSGIILLLIILLIIPVPKVFCDNKSAVNKEIILQRESLMQESSVYEKKSFVEEEKFSYQKILSETKKIHYCTVNERNASCDDERKTVCAYITKEKSKEIKCEGEKCYNQCEGERCYGNWRNACQACMEEWIEYWVEGPCDKINM